MSESSDDELQIRQLLSESLTPRGVDEWLRASNRVLHGARPLDLLDEAKVDEVRLAATAFINGSYV